MHIGKTGGTAISLTLARADVPAHGLVIHGHDWTLRDLPAGDSVFFVVRDPVARFMSGFYSRLREGRPRIFVPWSEGERRAFTRFATPNALGLALSSADEDERGAAWEAMRTVVHVRDSYGKWFGDAAALRARRDAIVFVASTEHLDEDFVQLLQVLDLPESLQLPSDDVSAHRNPRDLDYTLEDGALRNLRAWLRADYRLLDVLHELFPNLPHYER